MKAKNTNRLGFNLFMTILVCFIATSSFAQTKPDTIKVKDCCMMKDGKMMHMKAGKVEMMDREMTMKNGTKCMSNGECITLNGEKMVIREGECIDIYGNISTCGAIQDNEKPGMKSKESSKTTIMYSCPKHPEIEDDKPGTCPKCGTELVERK